MNREIKFRVWDNKEIRFRYNNEATINWDGVVFCNDYSGTCENERFTVQCFTGLKDKTGKEIYEGDILNIGDYDEHVYIYVTFEGGCFVVREQRGDIPLPLSDYNNYGFIMGNIFENGDLINK
jgi:uncharacterized phage protein (TIGR01671 family)